MHYAVSALPILLHRTAPWAPTAQTGHQGRTLSAVDPDFCQNEGLFHARPKSALDADADWLLIGVALHLVCREYRDVHQHLDLPAPKRWLASGALSQDGRLVSLDAVELCVGDTRPPAKAAKPHNKNAGPVRARRLCTTNRGGFSCNLPNAGNGPSIPGRS